MSVLQLIEASPYLGLTVLLLAIAVQVWRGQPFAGLQQFRPALDDPTDPAIIALAAGLKRSPVEVANAFCIGWSLLYPDDQPPTDA
jgi:hypothetical protein